MFNARKLNKFFAVLPDFQMYKKTHEIAIGTVGVNNIYNKNITHFMILYDFFLVWANSGPDNFNRFDVEFNRFSFIICASEVARFFLWRLSYSFF